MSNSDREIIGVGTLQQLGGVCSLVIEYYSVLQCPYYRTFTHAK
jgi:hypothetical protein